MGWLVPVVAVVAVFAVAVWVRRRGGRRLPAPPAPDPALVGRGAFSLEGEVELVSDCGGGDLPGEVLLTAVLTDGRHRVEARAVVEVIPDPQAEASTSRSVGRYALAADWPDGAGPPTHWEPPRVTRTDGVGVCEGLGCDQGGRCLNMAGRPRRIDVAAPATPYTARVACICVTL